MASTERHCLLAVSRAESAAGPLTLPGDEFHTAESSGEVGPRRDPLEKSAQNNAMFTFSTSYH